MIDKLTLWQRLRLWWIAYRFARGNRKLVRKLEKWQRLIKQGPTMQDGLEHIKRLVEKEKP